MPYSTFDPQNPNNKTIIAPETDISNPNTSLELKESPEDDIKNLQQTDESQTILGSTEDEVISVEPATVKTFGFKTKVNSGENFKVKEDLNMAEDRIGRKKYDSGKLNFGKLRKNLFGSGFKGLGRTILTVVALVMLLVVGFGVVGIAYISNLYQTTSINFDKPLSKSSIIYARDGSELFKIYGEDGKRQEIRSLDEVPEHLQLAVLALEDENYYKNNAGFSWYNLGGAVLKCASTIGRDCRGGSTIDQQYARQITGDGSRDKDEVLQRKLREIVRAYKLNEELSKQEILRRYLSTVYFGRNAYGVKEAALAFYAKEDLSTLTVAESCYIAAVLPSPNNYSNAFFNPESPFRKIVDGRKNACIDKLAELSIKGPNSAPVLTKEDAEAFKEEKVNFKAQSGNYKYPHFVEYVRSELIRILANGDESEDGKSRAENLLSTAGYKIHTSIDPKIQDKVEQVIRDQTQKNILDQGANNASAVVLDGPTGEILSMVGSRDYNDESIKGKVNVTTSPQQPGSSMKPYVYAAAFEKGFNPATILMDTQTTFNNQGTNYTPRNFLPRFTGAVSIRYALANSLNIPAVKAVWLSAGENFGKNNNKIVEAGVNRVVDVSEKMGVDFQVFKNEGGKFVQSHRQTCGPQLALGGCEVSGVSHAEGMNTFAQMGDRKPATPFIKICNSKEEDVYNGKMCDDKAKSDTNRCDINGKAGICNLKADFYKPQDKVIDPKIAYQVVDIMTDVDARTPVFGSTRFTLTLPDRKVAAKTGTSNDNRDLWTVGFTPQRTAVVWVGNTDNSETKDSSMRSAAPIWQNVMKVAVEDTSKDDFKRPDGMVNMKLSTTTGLIAGNGEAGIAQWITPDQKKLLEDAVNKSKTNPSDQDIFSLRTPLYGKVYRVSKIDNKLVTDENKDLIDPSTVEDRILTCPLSEFPWMKSWLDPVVAWAGRASNDKNRFECAPTELSTAYRVSSQDRQPTFEYSGFVNGWTYNNVINIRVKANPTVPGTSIKKTQILINGRVEAESQGAEAAKDFIMPAEAAAFQMTFRAIDSQNNLGESQVFTFITLPEGTPIPAGANKPPAPTPIAGLNINFVNPAPNVNLPKGANTIFSINSNLQLDPNPTLILNLPNGGVSAPIPLGFQSGNSYNYNTTLPSTAGAYTATLKATIGGKPVNLTTVNFTLI
jgi:membrane peptidoglycan carboxypeptidase